MSGSGAAPHDSHSPTFNVRRRSHPAYDYHDEARELRRMVRERDRRIDTLETVLEEVRQTALDLKVDAPAVAEMLAVINRNRHDGGDTHE